jgi:nucleoside-diphosphate-sugar epimerase
MPLRILVAGASGFIGQGLCSELPRHGYAPRGVYRLSASKERLQTDIESVTINSFNEETDWSDALRDIDVVINLVARVHVMQEVAIDPLVEYRRINVQGNLHLARQAALSGVKRFIYLSSIKVNGELTELGRSLTADDVPAPTDPYGISKFEAEEALRQIANETGMEVVIIRPPLVYGPGVKANFESMMRWIKRGLPLPLGAITHNRRSMVSLVNLVDLITVCLSHPAAANQVFLVSDGEDLSTTDLLERTAAALGVKARLFPLPTNILMLATKLLGKEAVYQRLCGSLQIDMVKTQQLLNWKPPLSVDAGLRLAAKGYE